MLLVLRVTVRIPRAGTFTGPVGKPHLGQNFLGKFHIKLLLSAS